MKIYLTENEYIEVKENKYSKKVFLTIKSIKSEDNTIILTTATLSPEDIERVAAALISAKANL